jgi:hypothetical protein
MNQLLQSEPTLVPANDIGISMYTQLSEIQVSIGDPEVNTSKLFLVVESVKINE